MAKEFIGTVAPGLYNLYTGEGHATHDISRLVVGVIESAESQGLLSRIRTWNRTRVLDSSVVVCYGPEFVEDDGIGGSVTGPVPKGLTLAEDILYIFEQSRGNN